MSEETSKTEVSAFLEYVEGAGETPVRPGVSGDLEATRMLVGLLREAGDAWRLQTCPRDLAPAVLEKAREIAETDEFHGFAAMAAAHRGITIPVDLTGAVLSDIARIREMSGTDTGLDESEAAQVVVLENRLRAIGDDLRRSLPKIDITARVMDAVSSARREESAPANVLPFRSRPKTETRATVQGNGWRIMKVAAAVALMAMVGATAWWMGRTSIVEERRAESRQSGAEQPETGRINHRGGALPSSKLASEWSKDNDRLREYNELLRPEARPIEIKLDSGAAGRLASLSLDDLLAAKRDALMKKDGGLEKLTEWGTLSQEEARRLLEEGGLSTSAMAGLLRFLPPEESAAFLRTAVEQHPEDPYLRYLLARNLAASPETRDEAIQQLAALKDISGENSLAYYMDAEMKMNAGDVTGALLSMQLGAGFESASAFGLESARSHAAALEAAGYEPAMARFLAASVAGRQEYASMVNLGQDLLQQGEYYESIKDYETANEIYQSVQELGAQVERGATLGNEQLAGYDLQLAALDAVTRVAEIFATNEGMEVLRTAYDVLADSMTGFVNYLGDLESLFGGLSSGDADRVSTQILTQGDLGLGQTP